MRVLLAHDGSRGADAALDDLRLAGLPDSAHARVISAIAPWTFLANVDAYGDLAPIALEDARARKEAKAAAKRAAERLRAAFPEWGIKIRTAYDFPARAILSEAENWRADLVVLGAHAHSVLGRIFLGSVSHKVIQYAPCPVRIVPAGKHRSRPHAPRLLIGVDGSLHAKRAVAHVASRHWPKGTRAHLLAVFDSRVLYAKVAKGQSLAGKAASKIREPGWMEMELAEMAHELSGTGVQATREVASGDPARELVAKAQALRSDCIFLGSRGLNAVTRFLLGSVSAAVANHAPCAVEIVREKKKPQKQ